MNTSQKKVVKAVIGGTLVLASTLFFAPSVLGGVARWVGLNFDAILKASVGAFFAGVIAIWIWRKDTIRQWLSATIVFFSIFGFLTSRMARNLVYLVTEDRELATGVQVGVLAATIGVTALVVLLRTRPRIAALVGFVSVFFLGTAVPTTVGLVPRTRRAVVMQPPAVSPIPAGYPSTAIWMNQEAGFGARFPDNPRRIGVAGVQGSGYAYQSGFTFEDGGAIASVTIALLPFSLDSLSQRTFLSEAHRTFLQSVGANADNSRSQWALFGNGAPILQYETRFSHDGLEFIGKGFWLIDRQRALRVAVTYPRDISPRSAAIADYFPSTFMLVGDSNPAPIQPPN